MTDPLTRILPVAPIILPTSSPHHAAVQVVGDDFLIVEVEALTAWLLGQDDVTPAQVELGIRRYHERLVGAWN